MIALMGCGAIGSLLALHLASPDREFLLVDDDRVGNENIATGAFYLHHVGALKAHVLAEMLARKCGCRATVETRTFGPNRARLVAGADLVVDSFDNAAARQATRQAAQSYGVPLLHVGVSEGRVGGTFWDEVFAMPDPDQYERGHNPVCTHHLGRPILRRTAVVAADVIERFLLDGVQRNEVVKL